jgi:hypothetical protein
MDAAGTLGGIDFSRNRELGGTLAIPGSVDRGTGNLAFDADALRKCLWLERAIAS